MIIVDYKLRSRCPVKFEYTECIFYVSDIKYVEIWYIWTYLSGSTSL